MSTFTLLRLAVPRQALAAVEEVLGALGAATYSDGRRQGDPVALEATLPATLEAATLTATLAGTFAAFGLALPPLALEPLAERDWVAESQRALPPERIGRFFVHGSHAAGPPPDGLIPLLIDANQAFGTGRHESTRGCLQALGGLAGERRCLRGLDLGCGSGVLAIGSAKLWPEARLLAADNDPVAVAVAAENARLNGVVGQVTALTSEGFAAPALAAASPYDLILANILAEPLIALAPDFARHLAPGGRLLLAGLLAREGAAVAAAQERAGLTLVASHDLGEWRSLLLTR